MLLSIGFVRMRSVTGNEIREGTPRTIGVDQPHRLSDSAKSGKQEHSLPPNSHTRPQDHREIIARATNDAVRDWDVTTGKLSWPQGLESLLGYALSDKANDIEFWQRSIHPQDRVRTTGSIREAISTNQEQWSGEYRFRHADGTYLHLLERAVILRNPEDQAVRLVGTSSVALTLVARSCC